MSLHKTFQRLPTDQRKKIKLLATRPHMMGLTQQVGIDPQPFSSYTCLLPFPEASLAAHALRPVRSLHPLPCNGLCSLCMSDFSFFKFQLKCHMCGGCLI